MEWEEDEGWMGERKIEWEEWEETCRRVKKVSASAFRGFNLFRAFPHDHNMENLSRMVYACRSEASQGEQN